MKAVLQYVAHFDEKTFFLCVVVITACTKLFGELFTVQHSPYPVSKFERGRSIKCSENGWEHFCDKQQHDYEKRQRKF